MKRPLYDCSHARELGKIIWCEKGKLLGKVATIDSIRHARGEPLEFKICMDCPLYDEMDGGHIEPEDRGWIKKW